RVQIPSGTLNCFTRVPASPPMTLSKADSTKDCGKICRRWARADRCGRASARAVIHRFLHKFHIADG
ncbi:MAG: hypothetical protein WBQ33_20560, partial [Candidatus Binatus sp.]